jgi:hypothetical protein
MGVQLKDLRERVQKTVQEQTKNAKLRGLSKEVEKWGAERQPSVEVLRFGLSPDLDHANFRNLNGVAGHFTRQLHHMPAVLL